jgi:DNA repair exonuclease SbcCD ATPase subunit
VTDDQAKTLCSDIGQIHYPASSPEQIREIRGRLLPFNYEAAHDAIREFARKHEYLNVEKLVAAVAELSASRNMQAVVERRERQEQERQDIAADAEWMDRAIESLSDSEFAAIVAEVRQRHDSMFTPRTWERGRKSIAVCYTVYQHLKARVGGAA